MAFGLTPVLAPDPWLLALAVAADLACGDPVYPWHPVRLIGRTLQAFERMLRRRGADGYGGGVLLFIMLAVVWAAGLSVLTVSAVIHLFFLYSFLALGDLLRHVRRVEAAVARGDIDGARTVVAQLVGRDTTPMDGAACRRAAVESLSENLADGFTSPLFWYVLGGLPGLVLFKVVSTMDSMVGYTTPEYIRFGWCGARLDDVMNYVPARLTWLLIAIAAAVMPACSARKAWRVGLAQHAELLGPNSGWSEAAAAGAVQRRLVGPIWTRGTLVTDRWIGDPADPPLETSRDVRTVATLVTLAGIGAAAIACALLFLDRH